MCYDIKAKLETQIQRAILHGDQYKADELKIQLRELIENTDLPIHHASGFQHPKLLIYTDRSPDFPEVSQWGLVPFWVKDSKMKAKIWNQTLNARSESIFEKPSFRDSAKKRRCLIYIDGFYEHHHFKNNSYPFYIYREDGKPIILAGLWSEWVDTETGEIINSFSIVTTDGNELLSKLHNNPKLDGPRMPVILHEEIAHNWLKDFEEELDKDYLLNLAQPFDLKLKSHPVAKLRGKDNRGNIEGVSDPFVYKELVTDF